LIGWQAPASFVPSLSRQHANRSLIEAELAGRPFERVQQATGLGDFVVAPKKDLMLSDIMNLGAAPFLSTLVLDNGSHVILFDGVKDVGRLRQLCDGRPGISFVDPARDVSDVLARYRVRAVYLLFVSALLMAPLLAWRYGIRGILPTLLPPTIAIALAPALLALVGIPFTFFSILGLILAFSIAVDYSVFFAEDHGFNPVTVTAVFLAMSTAVLSFGLLTISELEGMRTFGASMLVAVPLAAFISPWAVRAGILNKSGDEPL
jgi:predicted exporter